MQIGDLNAGITLQQHIKTLREWRTQVAQSDGLAFGIGSKQSIQAQGGDYATSNLFQGDKFAVIYNGATPAAGAPDMLCTRNVFDCAKTLMLAEIDRMIAQAEKSFEMLGNNGASA